MNPKTALDDLNALFDENKKCFYFPLSNGKKRIVGIKQLFSDGTEECEPFKNCYGILRYIPPKSTQKCTDAVIVSNLKDLIVLSSFKHSHHIICIPYGKYQFALPIYVINFLFINHVFVTELRSLPQEILPLLEQYSKLILWFGNSPNGLVATRQFSKKLHEERCYIIKFVFHSQF